MLEYMHTNSTIDVQAIVIKNWNWNLAQLWKTDSKDVRVHLRRSPCPSALMALADQGKIYFIFYPINIGSMDKLYTRGLSAVSKTKQTNQYQIY